MIGKIKNIRFTYQFTSATEMLSETSGGRLGSQAPSRRPRCAALLSSRIWKNAMTALTTPFAPTSCSQAFAAMAMATAVVRFGRWIADAWRHRHDAVALASFDD